jgi:hypothetical protein
VVVGMGGWDGWVRMGGEGMDALVRVERNLQDKIC